MSIRILAPDVVSKIAAGEVVERPASVVKELVENSLDAGATQVNVDVRSGGVGLVRVADNGTGIPEEEVYLAFERYATSKITSLSDLQKSTSLGFRGEALHSIAAVAQVELISATAENPAGIYVHLENGMIVERDVRACAIGTTIVVRNIFQSVPARLKFLKSQVTESSHIADLVTRMCLAFPSVQFTLTVDGKLALRTSGNGRLRDALIDVYGLEVAQAMIEVGMGGGELSPIVSSNTPLTTPIVGGYVSPPAISRSDRSYLSFFVNRRWVHSRLMTSAIDKAYQGRLMVGRHPIVVLNLLVPPQDIDVNVHPGKREIKFSQDQIVFTALHKTACRALETYSPVPETSIYRKAISSPGSIQSSWLMEPVDTSIGAPVQQAIQPTSPVPILRVLGQMAATYVIAEGPDGLYLIIYRLIWDGCTP
ncbi:MAG: DNA mismatch repair endonuclease MutL [Chloroflexota bacterium]|nr:DNA mismatch repair endonuclease MutL [Chloroflexota bacterium]